MLHEEDLSKNKIGNDLVRNKIITYKNVPVYMRSTEEEKQIDSNETGANW